LFCFCFAIIKEDRVVFWMPGKNIFGRFQMKWKQSKPRKTFSWPS
jgi:hypothetical protein